MKKIKWAIMAVAILVSIGGAFATNHRLDCSFSQQYYFNGVSYIPTGHISMDYVCLNSQNVCTYVFTGGQFVACQIGQYTALNIKDRAK
jgi:hypothetical protein